MPEYSRGARSRLAAVGASATRMRDALPRPLPGTRSRVLPTLSREAKWRLSILGYAKTRSVAATCRHFGIARATYYYWKRRYDPRDLRSLETRPSEPRRVRRPAWTTGQARRVRELRERYPRWGKHPPGRVPGWPCCSPGRGWS